MAYYVYVNWQAGPHKLVVHDGACGFCKEGQGLAGGYDPSHGRSHGPFATAGLAREFVEQTSAVVKVEHRCIRA